MHRHAVSGSSSDTLHLHVARQRERDGAAHAAAVRRPPAPAAVRCDDDAARARVRVSRFPRERGALLRHSRASHAARYQRGSGGGSDVRRTSAGSARRSPPGRRSIASPRRAPTATGSRPAASPRETPALKSLRRDINLTHDRDADPLTLLRSLTSTLYEELRYEPRTTRVDSPIDEALAAKARRVSGLRAHHDGAGPRPRHSVPLRQRLSRAALVGPRPIRPSMPRTRGSRRCCRTSAGSASIPPTTRSRVERHIAVAVGRDYGDVPPTRGVFKGESGSELGVAVSVTRAESAHAGARPGPQRHLDRARPLRRRSAADAFDLHQQQHNSSSSVPAAAPLPITVFALIARSQLCRDRTSPTGWLRLAEDPWVRHTNRRDASGISYFPGGLMRRHSTLSSKSVRIARVAAWRRAVWRERRLRPTNHPGQFRERRHGRRWRQQRAVDQRDGRFVAFSSERHESGPRRHQRRAGRVRERPPVRHDRRASA